MRLPVAVPPARHETSTSYLARLASLHGLDPRELWHLVSTPRPGTRRRVIIPDRLATITGRPGEHLARALPALRRPEPDWQAWRHQPQPRCPRCDARHDGGPVARLLPHHRYVCTRHRYWIGPPDAGQPATPLVPELADIIQAQWRHLRLLRRYGTAATYDAVLTGFLICGHLWGYQPGDWPGPWHEWTRRAQLLIPPGCEASHFSASRIFAAAYRLARLALTRRRRPIQQQQFTRRIGQLLGRPGYQPGGIDDPIAHWIKYDSWRRPAGRTPPSRRPVPTGRPARPPPAGKASTGPNAAACGSNSTATAATSSCTTATSCPSSSATGPRRWTASPPPSGPAKPRCPLGATTAPASPNRERDGPGCRQRPRTSRRPRSNRLIQAGGLAMTGLLLRFRPRCAAAVSAVLLLAAGCGAAHGHRANPAQPTPPKARPTPSATGYVKRADFLTGVACLPAGACVAVGWYYYGTAGPTLTLAARWNGHTWQAQPTPSHGHDSQLDNLSCASATSCIAVGTPAEAWAGTGWTVIPPAGPVSSLSCPAPGSCQAVGPPPFGTHPVAARWDGRTWQAGPLPTPAPAPQNLTLTGISCTSARFCMAVGDASHGAQALPSPTYRDRTLAEEWNGSRWQIVHTPNPSRASELRGVSCTSPRRAPRWDPRRAKNGPWPSTGTVLGGQSSTPPTSATSGTRC
jgi:hypothetical protein